MPDQGQDHKFDQLRMQAEELLDQHTGDLNLPRVDILGLIHELRIHQAELQIQNEELQRSQRELTKLHQEYEELYEFAPCGYLTLNNKGIITRINLTATRLLEATRKLIQRQTFNQFIERGWEYAFIAARLKSAQTGERQSLELPLKRKNITPAWVRVEIEADNDGTGAVRQWRIVLMDITLNKFTESALVESEERFRALFEHAPVAYQSLDENGNLITVNEAWLEIMGYSEVDVIGKNFFDFLHPDWKERFKENFTQFRTVSDALGNEFVMQKKDGTGIIVSLQDKISKDQSGKFDNLYCVFFDITTQREVESENKLLEEKLRQAKKMESIGTLAGGIAHNFNNILMGIQGNVSLMLMDKDPSHPDLERLHFIKECVKSATELTRDLLGFARGGKYLTQPTDLNMLVKSWNWMYGQTNKEIKVYEKFEKDLWIVEVDQGQIKQVLLNLYINAWQAMPGGGNIHVQTENVIIDKEFVAPFEIVLGRYVKISVTDTGIGMKEEIREKIFEPFYSTKGMALSSGLGLASVYGIIKNHGGFITVRSEVGEGATFDIFLPVSDQKILGEDPEPDRYDIQYGQATILLVDDEVMIIDVGQKMLERLGYRVLIARSGDEAIDVFEKRRNKIALVILDMVMPGMGGGETYDRMKEIDGNVKVLLSSGYSLDGQAKEIVDRGCMGFIQKPFSLNDLSITVCEALKE